MKYHHTHFIANTPQEKEKHNEEFDTYSTDFNSNPYGIAWMRCGRKCTLPEIIKKVPHLGFEVENIEEAIKEKEVLMESFYPAIGGVKVAFVVENGVPVELIEYLNK
jgi:hypothetical protein